MKQIPTAKELFDKMIEENEECTSTEMMIEFAKLHVEAALKEVNEEVIENDDLQGECYSGKHHMKNCYPLENIK